MANEVAKAGGSIWKTVSSAPLILTGILIGLAAYPFVCGKHIASKQESADTVFVKGNPDTVFKDRWNQAFIREPKGIPLDSSSCPEFTIQGAVTDEGDTVSVFNINARTQTASYIWVQKKDTVVTIRETDTKLIRDTIILTQEQNVPELGYDVSPYLTTEAFGIQADGSFKQYHLYIGPRIEYLLPVQGFWQRFHIEAGFSFSLLSSSQH